MNTEEWLKQKHSCSCAESEFCDPEHKHIVSGDLRLIKNNKLRSLLCKGPKYREARKVNWNFFESRFKSALETCIEEWGEKEKCSTIQFKEWKEQVLKDISTNISTLIKVSKRKKLSSILNDLQVKSYLEELQRNFVFVPTDKAGSNISVVCKQFYIQKSLEELGICDLQEEGKNVTLVGAHGTTAVHSAPNSKTYQRVQEKVSVIVQKHTYYLTENLKPFTNSQIPQFLPILYWIPKMRKQPSKQRYIAASNNCSAKPLSAILTKCLKQVENIHRVIGKRYYMQHGINPFWIIANSTAVYEKIAPFNRTKECTNIRTYDFTNMYTSIPHQLLKTQIKQVVKTAFEFTNKPFLNVYKNYAHFAKASKGKALSLDYNKLCELIDWLIDNIFVTFGEKVFQQTIGIPMGTDCAPFLANLFCYSYEFKWIDDQVKLRKFNLIKLFC